ncbi:MAG: hypothetical protein IJU37_03195 [Desulfovibrio sp.]|nr:hypothetical protein [Desulfovibrio sp.]
MKKKILLHILLLALVLCPGQSLADIAFAPLRISWEKPYADELEVQTAITWIGDPNSRYYDRGHRFRTYTPHVLLHVPGPCDYELSLKASKNFKLPEIHHAGSKESFGAEDIKIPLDLAHIPSDIDITFEAQTTVKLYRYDRKPRESEKKEGALITVLDKMQHVDIYTGKTGAYKPKINPLGYMPAIFRDAYTYTFKDKNGQVLSEKSLLTLPKR